MPTAEAEVYVLNERVLSDDTLAIAPEGHVFPGRYVAILTYHTYRNPNADVTHVRRFRSMAACEAFVLDRYGRPWEELVYGSDDEDD